MPTTPAGRARATHHTGLTTQDIEVHFDAVETTFNKNWLESGNTHRIQKVWHRDDPLATLELISLGYAILTMRKIDASWVKRIARKARSDGNRSHGWIFELIGAAMLAGAGMDVLPMPENFPGYDIEIRFADGYRMKVSMKSHDMSAHEEGFQQGCNTLREIAASRFRGATPSLFLQVNCTNHLGKIRMAAVHEWVSLLLSDLREQNQHIVLGDTRMTWSAPKTGFLDVALHPLYYSDTVQVFSRQHHKEQLRFEKNLLRAANGFSNIVHREPDSCHVIMMRVHPTANVDLLATYARNVLDEPGCNADAVWIYQPAVAHDHIATSLTHTLKMELHMHRYSLNHPVKLVARYGKLLSKSTEIQLVGSGINLKMPDSYFFQQADHYSPMTIDAQGIMKGVANAPAPGVRIHSVFGDLTGSMVLSGKYPAHDELSIL